jgi:threonine dehydrogenase-like Zn-dependent dehydrogenase
MLSFPSRVVSDHLLRAGIRVAPVESRLKDAMPQQNALVREGGTVVAVRPVTVPEAPPGWVAVNIAYAGICGSDLHIPAGKHIRVQPGQVLGHGFVGHLAEPHGDLPVGQPVFVTPVVGHE